MSEAAHAGYRGYEYQIQVSLLLALDLIVARRICDEVTIEPPSDEDIAANLDVQSEAASTTLLVPHKVQRVEIQIKRRSQMLTAADFRALLTTKAKAGNKGRAPRLRALDLLRGAPDLRFVVVTNAQVHADLAPFVVDDVTRASEASALKGANEAPELYRRLGIVVEKNPPLIEHEIRGLLEVAGRIPFQRVESCHTTLVERIRGRLLRRLPPVLTRDDLLADLRAHGAFADAVQAEFVPPTNFAELRERLERAPHALLLVGPPGAGKTFAAERLIEEHRQAERPFHVVPVHDVADVRAALHLPGRTLFYVEDPWGRYQLATRAGEWSDELPRLIRQAQGHPDKRFLVTSRASVLAEGLRVSPATDPVAYANEHFGAFVMQVGAEHFDKVRRREILARWMDGASRWQCDWLERVEREVLRELRLPLALASFAHRLRMTPLGTEPDLPVLLAQSQTEAITVMVAQAVATEEYSPSALVFWMFAGTRQKLSRDFAARLSGLLQDRGERSTDLPRLIVLLERNGWLRERNGELTLHPSVVDGLERVVSNLAAASLRMFGTAFEALMADGHVDVAVDIAAAFRERSRPVPPNALAAMEQHLLQAAVTASERTFVAAAHRLASLSNAGDPVSMLIRALIVKDRQRGIPRWLAPAWTEEAHKAVRSSAAAQSYLRRWIALGFHSYSFAIDGKPLVEFMRSFDWDLDDEWHAAAVEALSEQSITDIALIGALAGDRPRYDELLEAAFAATAEVDEWMNVRGGPDCDRANEGELDAMNTAHLLEEPGEHYFVPRHALELIIAARRRREGFQWLSEHPRVEQLISGWAEAIPADSGDSAAEELGVLLDKSMGWSRREVFEAIGKARCRGLSSRLVELLGAAPVSEAMWIWSALFALHAPGALAELVADLFARTHRGRRLALAFAAQRADVSSAFHHEPQSWREAVADALTGAERQALAVFVDLHGTRSARISQAALDALADAVECTLASNPEDAARAALGLAFHQRDVDSALDQFIKSSEDRVRTYAYTIAAESQRRALLRQGLLDKHYRCRRIALYSLAAQATPEERSLILAAAQDPSAPMREACADVIARYGWRDGLAVLVRLLRDTRDRATHMSQNHVNPHLHVARTAATALACFPAPLATDIVDDLFAFMNEGASASKDLVVHAGVLLVLARHVDPRLSPLLARLLKSVRRVGGPNGTFPLRFEALWQCLEHLVHFPADVEAVPLLTVIDAAGHSDGRMAAPALMVLGALAPSMSTSLRDLTQRLAADSMQLALVHAGSFMVHGRPAAAAGAAPGARLLALMWDTELDDAQWRERLAADAEATDWFADVKHDGPLQAALRYALSRSPRAALLGEIRLEDLRADEMPEGVELLTIFDFGHEQ